MEKFRIETGSGASYDVRVTEVEQVHEDLIRTLIEIDLQTFSESTFSHYTASVFLRQGRVFLLSADDMIIGTCVCMRAWERPNEASILTMGIRPGWRGRGLGQKFLMGVVTKLRARGLRAVSLMVSEDNRRAIRLYEESGFQRTGDYSAEPRTGERFMVMRSQLITPNLTPLPGPHR